MSDVNNGTQNILFRYKLSLDSNELNVLYRDIVNPGVHYGLDITPSGAGNVDLSPGVIVLRDSANNGQVVVVKTEDVAVVTNLSTSLPYICAKYTYKAQTGWYADFFAASQATAYSTDVVILGRVEKFVSLIPNIIDVKSRTLGNCVKFRDIYDNLRISEIGDGVTTNKVKLAVDSTLVTPEGLFSVPQSAVAALTFDAASASDRYDIVGVNSFGQVVIVKGSSGGSPGTAIYKGLYPLAEVKILASGGASYIIRREQIRDLRQMTSTPSGILTANNPRGYLDEPKADLTGVISDFNLVTGSGKYWLSGVLTHGPLLTSTLGFILYVNSNSNNTIIFQRAYSISDQRAAVRSFYGGAWTAWTFCEDGYDYILETPGTGTWTAPMTGAALIYVVGAGGAGGSSTDATDGGGGGGGGGHVVVFTRFFIAGNTYGYTVGAHGTPNTPGITGGNGYPSNFDGIVANGGDGGAGSSDINGANGGSGGTGGGGGGAHSKPGQTGVAGTHGSGDNVNNPVFQDGGDGGNGGVSVDIADFGGGGGGGGGHTYADNGGNGNLYQYGLGGVNGGRGGDGSGTIGKQSCGGGGGGGGYGPGSYGGQGADTDTTPPVVAAAGYRGGGGGGGGSLTSYTNGAAGGDGVIYIKYMTMTPL